MLAQLIPLDGGPPIELSSDLTLVGRKTGVCDLVLDRGSVSKMHCLIVKTDGLLFIRDLGSTNGTKVNGQKITRGALLPGDELAFASAKFRVHLGPGKPSVDQHMATEMLSAHPETNGDSSGSFDVGDLDDRVLRNPHDSDSGLHMMPDESAV